MSFWTSPDMKILPKFRFSLNFGGVIWWVKTAQFPKLSQEKKEIQTGFGGNSVYKPGPAKWQPITVTFADVMIPQTEGVTTRDMSTQMFWFGMANILDDHQQKSGLLISRENGVYNEGFVETWLDGVLIESGGKLNKIEIERHYQEEYDANEKWIVENILISEIDFGGGDYSSDELNEISITFSYDIARPETTDEASPFFQAGEASSNLQREKKQKIRKRVQKRKAKNKPKWKASLD